MEQMTEQPTHTGGSGQDCYCHRHLGLEEQGTYSHFFPSSTMPSTVYVRATTFPGVTLNLSLVLTSLRE